MPAPQRPQLKARQPRQKTLVVRKERGKLQEIYESAADFCAAIGCSMAIVKAVRVKDSSAFLAGGRVETVSFLRSLFKMEADATGLQKGFRSWKDYKDKQEALQQKEKLDRIKKDSMSYSEGRRQAATAVANIRREQQRMEQELPPIIKGMSEIEIHAQIKRFHENSWKKLKDDFENIGEPETE